MFAAIESLRSNTQTGVVQNPVESSDALFTATANLFELDAAFENLNALSSTIDDLENLSGVIASHGVTTSLLAFTNKNKILSDTLPSFAAIESLGYDASVGSTEVSVAQEELSAYISSATASWFKSAWDAVSGFAGKIGEFIMAAAKKVGEAASWVAGKVWDAAKATKNVIVAHPIASAVAAIAALAGGAAIIGSIWGLPFPVSQVALPGWIKSVVDKVNAALGRFGFRLSGNGAPVAANDNVLDVTKNATPAVLGFTKESSTDFIKRANTELSSGQFSKVRGLFTAAAKAKAEVLNKENNSAPGYLRQALNFLLRTSHAIWQFVTSKPVKIVTSTVGHIRGLFKSKSEAGSGSEEPAAPMHIPTPANA